MGSHWPLLFYCGMCNEPSKNSAYGTRRVPATFAPFAPSRHHHPRSLHTSNQQRTAGLHQPLIYKNIYPTAPAIRINLSAPNLSAFSSHHQAPRTKPSLHAAPHSPRVYYDTPPGRISNTLLNFLYCRSTASTCDTRSSTVPRTLKNGTLRWDKSPMI